ncbi:hypothetical protein VP01_3154g3 [Puccinia sorghi]|uniref:Uncharacterized protein n=1 Tax=Puccinia sorghi TaxID=27349 RepID=A0A0L6UYU0_9BASI|nr:hypothetical protein VP01_3154g3 [Puccinia sorghi]
MPLYHFLCQDLLQTISTTDLLIRSLLLRSDQPAVILLGHFAPQFQNEHGFTGPEVWHSAVAHFYDVPHLTYAMRLIMRLKKILKANRILGSCY